jgi:hypothetical protein
MANMTFDFNKIPRSFLTVVLKDKSKLLVKMPKKSTFEKMTALPKIDDTSMDPDAAFDTLATICAEILSNNMQQKQVSPEYMAAEYDIEEMQAFTERFMQFCDGLKSDPN